MIELKEFVTKKYKEFNLFYEEFYYLDYEIDEKTGLINKNKKVKYYTKDQINRNLESIKKCLICKLK
jgi:hypothetical protein